MHPPKKKVLISLSRSLSAPLSSPRPAGPAEGDGRRRGVHGRARRRRLERTSRRPGAGLLENFPPVETFLQPVGAWVFLLPVGAFQDFSL